MVLGINKIDIFKTIIKDPILVMCVFDVIDNILNFIGLPFLKKWISVRKDSITAKNTITRTPNATLDGCLGIPMLVF